MTSKTSSATARNDGPFFGIIIVLAIIVAIGIIGFALSAGSSLVHKLRQIGKLASVSPSATASIFASKIARGLAILGLATCLLLGCGSTEKTLKQTSLNPYSPRFLYKEGNIPPIDIDPRIEALLQGYQADASSFGLDTAAATADLRQIQFIHGLMKGNLPDVMGQAMSEPAGTLGICLAGAEVNSINEKTVQHINLIFFDDSVLDILDSMKFQSLAYHEFSHCLIGAVHTPWSTQHIASVGERIATSLALQGVGGLPIDPATGTAYTTGGASPSVKYSDIGGLAYPTDIVSVLQAQAQASYDFDLKIQYQVMAPYLEDNETYWQDNWDELKTKLFVTNGGKQP